MYIHFICEPMMTNRTIIGSPIKRIYYYPVVGTWAERVTSIHVYTVRWK